MQVSLSIVERLIVVKFTFLSTCMCHGKTISYISADNIEALWNFWNCSFVSGANSIYASNAKHQGTADFLSFPMGSAQP